MIGKFAMLVIVIGVAERLRRVRFSGGVIERSFEGGGDLGDRNRLRLESMQERVQLDTRPLTL